MVVEDIQGQVTPFGEWMFGPNWRNAALARPIPLAVLVAVVVLLAAWILIWLRKRKPEVSGRASLGGGLACAVLAFGLPVLAAGFAFLASLGERAPTLAKKAVFLLSGLDKLLGANWYQGVFYRWAVLMACLSAAVFAIGWLVAALRAGPGRATVRGGQVMLEALADLGQTSLHRTLALAWLAAKESIRRKIVVVFMVFAAFMLFAGWFLNPGSDQPARLYIQVVLTATMYLTMVFSLVLSALSLPADIKDRTLFTIVTKPVRKTEIILGRILGFGFVGTCLLALMGAISYGATVRLLSHRHEVTTADLHDIQLPGKHEPLRKGLTSKVHNHQHEVTIDSKDRVTVEPKQGHTHELLETIATGDNKVYKFGPPEGLFVARVPKYAKQLKFKDRAGLDADKGVNVGDEWMYRSFIAGGSAAAAIWSFDGMTANKFSEEEFPEGLPLEMTLEVFRTYKGDVEKPILGVIWVRNPETGRKVIVRNFLAKKFVTDQQVIPWILEAKDKGATEQVDLAHDIITADGRMEVGIQCLEREQFFGMAQPDLYFRAADASFAGNFLKGYLGIWMQMMLVLAIGVMCSTFLSGPVAVLATLGVIIGGLFSSYVTELAQGKVTGGGPFEAFIRIINQDNLISELPQGLQTNVAHMSDTTAQGVLWVAASTLPTFSTYDYVNDVANGFNVDLLRLLQCLLTVGAYVFPVFILGYLFLKLREVAK